MTKCDKIEAEMNKRKKNDPRPIIHIGKMNKKPSNCIYKLFKIQFAIVAGNVALRRN